MPFLKVYRKQQEEIDRQYIASHPEIYRTAEGANASSAVTVSQPGTTKTGTGVQLTPTGVKLTAPGENAPVEVKKLYDRAQRNGGVPELSGLEKGLERTANAISAGVKGTGAALVNIGGRAMEGLEKLNDAAFDSQYAQRIEAAQNSLDYWQGELAKATTDADRQRAQTMIDRANRTLANYEQLKTDEKTGLTKAAGKLYEKADTIEQNAAEDTEKAKEGLGAAGQLLVDAGVSGTQMLGDAALNVLLPGAGLAALGVRAYGGATQKARQEGATYGQAGAAGALTAATEILTEKMFGVFEGIYGKGLLDKSKLVKAVGKAVGKLNGTAFGTILGSMGEEALEEVVAGAIEPAFEYIYGGEGYNEDTASDIVSAAIVGGIMGGIGGAGNVIANRGVTITKDGVKLSAVTPAEQVQKNTATEAEKDFNDKSKNDSYGLLNLLRANIPSMENTLPVKTVTGKEISSDGKITDRVYNFFQSIGGKVHRNGFGEVLFSKSKVKSSLVGHGVGNAKIELAAAVPEVIQKGVQINYTPNWKGRGYDSFVFAAPVTYKNGRTYVTVIVTKDNESNRYYLHEALDADGNVLYKKEEGTDTASDRPPVSGMDTVADIVPSNAIVPQQAAEVKPNVLTEEDSLKMSLAEGMGLSTPRTRAQEAAAIEAEKAAQDETTRAAMEEAGEKLPKPQTPNAAAMTVNGVTYDVTTPEGTAAYQEAAKAAQSAADAKAFTGTNNAPADSSLAKLGVNVTGDQGDYRNVAQVRANEQAKRAARKDVQALEAKLMPNNEEKHIAHQVANGSMREQYIYTDEVVNRYTVLQLAEAYRWQSATENKTMAQQRAIIRDINERGAKQFFEKVGDDVKHLKMIVMNERTPERISRAMFGPELGEEFNEMYFYTTQHNEAEKNRFIRRQLDDVRTFAGKDGKAAPLTMAERETVQKMLENRFVPEEVAKMETSNIITNAAKNIRNGEDVTDTVKEFNLSQEEKTLAERLVTWMEAQEQLNSGAVDEVKVNAAVEAYAEKYNQFYDAINDFLVAHGYEPIGFIKGYAPHMQGAKNNSLLTQAMQALGVKEDAATLPTSISGKTADYKPGKRFVPNFLRRNSTKTEYDVARGFESYVNYVADVFYHTDDIARVRGAEKYLRKKYAPEELSALIDSAQALRTADQATVESALRDAGKITGETTLSYKDTRDRLEDYISDLYDSAAKVSKYAEFAKYLDNYANILAGKQSMADRGMEFMAGRESLNVGNRLLRYFGQAQVAGNFSSVLNQTSQLAQIQAEVPQKYIISAIRDICQEAGSLKGLWDFKHVGKMFDTSDLLSGKKGTDYLTAKDDWQDRLIDGAFKLSDTVDGIVSAIAYQSKLNQAMAEGKPRAAAELEADRWATSIMGSRAKGSRPMAFESKNTVVRMLNMFQLEALNSADHLASDLPGKYQKIKTQQGEEAASRYFAALATKGLLSTFILNRVVEMISGGTPAPFDLLGYLLRFFSSALGVSSNELLKHGIVKLLNNTLGGLTGENEIDETKLKELQEFDAGRGLKEARRDLERDVPLLNNGLALVGLGDSTMPLAGIGESIEKVVKTANDDGITSPKTGEAVLGLGATIVPYGRQAQKTYQGAQTLIRGGKYYGYGEDKRLQYPVEPSVVKGTQMLLFGPSATEESRAFYASGGKGLSAAQTEKVDALSDGGMNKTEAYNIVRGLSTETKNADKAKLVILSGLTEENQISVLETIYEEGTLEKFKAATAVGIRPAQFVNFQERADACTGRKGTDGKTISGSKKEQVLNVINGMDLTTYQKDVLYRQMGYSEKEIKDAPWWNIMPRLSGIQWN